MLCFSYMGGLRPGSRSASPGAHQASTDVKSPTPLKLFVFCPLRADRFVGADTSSRSCIARYVLGTACYARKSDTFFRIELACLGPRLASAELIRARTDGKTSARFEIFAAKRESRREKASLAPACVARPAHQSSCGARRRGRCAAERPGGGLDMTPSCSKQWPGHGQGGD